MWTAPSTAGGLLRTSGGPGGSCPSSCRGSGSNICLRAWATVSRGTGDPGRELWAELLETEPPLPLRSVYVVACGNALDAPVARWGGGGGAPDSIMQRTCQGGCGNYAAHVLSASAWRSFLRALADPRISSACFYFSQSARHRFSGLL